MTARGVEGWVRRHRAIVGAALVVGAVVLQLLRQRGNPSWASLWAEDGYLLLEEALRGDAVGNVFESYAGYLVLVPRLLALPVAWVPVADAPAYFAVVSSVVVALLAAAAYRWTGGWIDGWPARGLVAAFVCLSPSAAIENTATLINVIWPLAMVAPWALLARRRGRADTVGRAAVLAGAAASTPAGIAFLPVAGVLAWRRRDRTTIAVVAVYAVASAVQLAFMATSDGDPLPVERPLSDFVLLVGVRIAGVFLIGPEQAGALWRSQGTAAGVVATVVVLGLFALALPGAGRRAQLVGAMFLAYGYGVFIALLWSRGTQPFRALGLFEIRSHMRYSTIAVFFVVCAFACVLAPVGDAARGVARRVGRPLFVAHGTVLLVLCFATVALRGLGPTWPEQMARVEPQCAGADPDHIVVVPQDAGPFWGVRMTCDDLLG